MFASILKNFQRKRVQRERSFTACPALCPRTFSFNDSPVDLYLDFSRFIKNFIWNDNNIAPLLHQKFESLHIELKASKGSITEDDYAKADR